MLFGQLAWRREARSSTGSLRSAFSALRESPGLLGAANLLDTESKPIERRGWRESDAARRARSRPMGRPSAVIDLATAAVIVVVIFLHLLEEPHEQTRRTGCYFYRGVFYRGAVCVFSLRFSIWVSRTRIPRGVYVPFRASLSRAELDLETLVPSPLLRAIGEGERERSREATLGRVSRNLCSPLEDTTAPPAGALRLQTRVQRHSKTLNRQDFFPSFRGNFPHNVMYLREEESYLVL